MRALARFKNEIWCMDLAFVDKLAKDSNGKKYLLVPQDMSDRTVDAKGMKTKDSKETAKIFSKLITKKNRPEQIWVDQGTEFAGDFKKVCVAEVIHVYSTMSETKATLQREQSGHSKYLIQIYGGIWIQIYSQIASVCQHIEIEKNSHDKHGTKRSQEFRFYVNSVW